MTISGVFAKIFLAVESDENVLPALPEIIISLRNKLNDPECTIKVAADVLKSDPGLSAYIMRVSNSARYMFATPPRDLDAAVMRLGLASTASLATAHATRAMFNSDHPKLKKLMIESYHNATRISILCCLLAERLTGFDPDEAMLAGLLQDIAIPPLLMKMADRPEIFDSGDARNRCIDELAPKVNALIMKHWGFNEKFIEVMRARKKWQRHEQDELDMADIVLIARWYSMMGTPDFSNCPPFEQIPALQKLPGTELTADHSLKLLDESRQQIIDLENTLHAAA